MNRKLLLLTAVVFFIIFHTVILIAQNQVDIRLVKVSQEPGVPSPLLERLTIDVQAQATESSINFSLFNGSFLLDAILQGQSPSVTFTTQFTNSGSYLSFNSYAGGSVSYLYTHTTGPYCIVGTTAWTTIVTVEIEYTMNSGLQSSIALGSYAVVDDTEPDPVDVTGIKIDIPSNLKAPDFTLPVEISTIMALSNPGSGVTLTWRTESEVKSSGFHVWRSEYENGNYIRITPNLILSHGNSTTAHEYSFTDETAQDGIR